MLLNVKSKQGFALVETIVLVVLVSLIGLIFWRLHKAPSVEAANSTKWGMNGVDILQAPNDTDRLARLADIKVAGAYWVRLDITWSYIQPTKTTWNWNYYDKVMNQIQQTGLQPILLIDYGNTAFGSKTNSAPPTNYQDFANFAATVAKRYAPLGFHTYEVWNEPNLGQTWGGTANAANYTKLLKVTYHSIKSADSNATVLSAGIAPTTDGNGNISQQKFLKSMYSSGVKGYFTALGYHPYVGSGWDQLPQIRQIMVNNGDSSKKIWATETGWSTYGVTDQSQVDRVNSMMGQWKTFSWGGVLSWYSHRDTATDGQGNFFDHFGLQRVDDSHKPAWDAFKAQVTN